MRAEICDRSRLSILQLMRVVIFFAVAFACVAPLVRLRRVGVVQGDSVQGLLFIIIFEAVAVPLVWVLLSFVLVRRGTGRDAQ